MGLNDQFKEVFRGALKDASDAVWCRNFLPTGIVSVDLAICGGFGEGRVHEVFGPWSTAKTLLLYAWLIENQRRGGKSFLYEAEGAFDPDWYQRLGGQYKKDDESLLLYPDLRTAEEFFAGVLKIVEVVKKTKFKGPVAIGLDSIAAMGTKHLHKQGIEGSRDMTKAFVMDQGTKLIVAAIQGTRITVVATNQVRDEVGAPDWAPTHTPGGKAWPFFSSVRIELKFNGGPKGSLLLADEMRIGRSILGEVVKNKQGPPHRRFWLSVYTEEGKPHPVFDGPTPIGVDFDEALLDYYLLSPHAVVEGERLVQETNNGRLQIHPRFGASKGFLKKNWREVLEKFPKLKLGVP